MLRRALFVLAALISLIAGGAYATWRWVESAAGEPVVTADVVLEVPKGASGPKVPKLLVDAKLLDDPKRAHWYLKLHPAFPKFGKHQLKAGMTLGQVLEALAENPLADDAPVTILEGWRLIDTDKGLAGLKPPLLAAGAYLKAAQNVSRFKIPFDFTAQSLEGYLYPETYLMPVGHLDADQLIQRQLDSFHEKFSKPYADEIKKSGRTLHELVIVASMLEREEPKPENRPLIAGIIYKRLTRSFPLGIDATSRYPLEDWNDRTKFLQRLRDALDPYNTRLRQGLPAGPIGSPNITSLLAALRPESSEWLYYLHDKNHVVHFARDAAEHEANRKQFDVY